jgi:hypothetical protein
VGRARARLELPCCWRPHAGPGAGSAPGGRGVPFIASHDASPHLGAGVARSLAARRHFEDQIGATVTKCSCDAFDGPTGKLASAARGSRRAETPAQLAEPGKCVA